MKDRIFDTKDKNGNVISVHFKRPTQAQILSSDFIFKKCFSEAIRNGIMTSVEALKLLRDQGAWNDDSETQSAKLRDEISEIEMKFKQGDLIGDDGDQAYLKIKDLRTRLNEITSLVSNISENTADSYASDAKTRWLAAECSFHSDGKRKIFKDAADFSDNHPSQLTLDCYRASLLTLMEIAIGLELPSSVDGIHPEDAWLNAKSSDVAVKTEDIKIKRGRKKIVADSD